METVDWKTRASKYFCIFSVGAVILIFCRYLLPSTVPFLLAGLTALVILPLSARLSKHGGSKRMWALILLLMFLAVSVLAALLIANRLSAELDRLFTELTKNPEGVENFITGLSEKISAVSAHIPWLTDMRESENISALLDKFDSAVETSVASAVGKLTESIPNLAMRLISGFPSFILSLTVFIISGFYFCLDSERIAVGINRILPSGASEFVKSVYGRFSKTLSGVIRAYLLIMLITFIELYIGFKLLKIDLALILALLTAVVDILPVLGIGTVLLPWAVGAFLFGKTGLGFGLLVLYAVMLVVRQIIEPRIVGKSIGLHPLVTLVSMYLGFKLAGIIGMIALPIISALVFAVVKGNMPSAAGIQTE